MLRILSIASLALAVVSAVSGHVVRHRRGPPQGWATAYLEPYGVYHHRYLDFGCKHKHNTTYFSNCCHPLLKNESISVLQDRNCFSTADSTSEKVNCDGNPPVPPASANPFSSPPAVTEQSTPTSSAPPLETPARPAGVEKFPVSPAEQGPTPVATTTTTSTPAWVPPTTTTTTTTTSTPPWVPPTTTTTTTATPTPTPTNSGTNGGDWQSGGFGTYYYQYGHAGACRQYHADTDLIAAIDATTYGDTTLVSSLCGKQVEIINLNNQNSVTVTIEDACPSCDNANSIDLSISAFEALSDLSVGHIPIKWRFV